MWCEPDGYFHEAGWAQLTRRLHNHLGSAQCGIAKTRALGETNPCVLFLPALHQLWGWLMTHSKVCVRLPWGESKLCLAKRVQGPSAAITPPSFAIWTFSSFSGTCSQEGRSCPVRVWGSDWPPGSRVWAYLLATVPLSPPQGGAQTLPALRVYLPWGTQQFRRLHCPLWVTGCPISLAPKVEGDAPEGTTSWETQVPSLMSHLSPSTPRELLKFSRISSPCSAILDGETDPRVKR